MNPVEHSHWPVTSVVTGPAPRTLSAPGLLTVPVKGHLTAQLYFPGDEHNDDDIASAVKPELILDPLPADDGATVAYGFVLDPVRG